MEENIDEFSYIKIQNFSSTKSSIKQNSHRLKGDTLMHITNK